MSEPRLTMVDLIKAIQKKSDVSNEKAKDFINSYFSIIAEELKEKNTSSIYKFGTFKKQWKKQRTGRNPRTGESIEVPGRYNISFSPVPAIAEKINKPYAKLKSVIIKKTETQKKEAEDKLEDSSITAQEFEMLTSTQVHDQQLDTEDFDDIFGLQVEAEIKEIAAQEVEKAQTSEKEILPDVYETTNETEQKVEQETLRQPQVREQIIERQVIKEQIIEQRVTKKIDMEEQSKMQNTDSGIDYRAEERIIARCWFVAGIAVVCTIIIVAILVYVVIGDRRTKIAEQNVAIAKLEQQIADAREIHNIKANAYAEIAAMEYGEPRLWPYIYSANRLRHSEPDYDIKLREAVIPPMPDRTLDRTSIEQSAIDAYRMYKNEYSDRPSSARGKDKRLRAVKVIADTEQLLRGFISRYELSLDIDDIQLARRYLGN